MALSYWECYLPRVLLIEAFEVAANELDEPNKAKLELELTIWRGTNLDTNLSHYVFTVG